MGLKIVSRVLPGIGMCQELDLHDGRRVGIVTRRNGTRDIVVYDEDGDGAAAAVTLNDDEADALAELLGAPKLVNRLSDQQSDADAVITEQLPVAYDSRYSGRPLGETKARTRTGASIVAVLRAGATHPSPGPEFVLEGGDLVITVGTREGLDRVAELLDRPPG